MGREGARGALLAAAVTAGSVVYVQIFGEPARATERR